MFAQDLLRPLPPTYTREHLARISWSRRVPREFIRIDQKSLLACVVRSILNFAVLRALRERWRLPQLHAESSYDLNTGNIGRAKVLHHHDLTN